MKDFQHQCCPGVLWGDHRLALDQHPIHKEGNGPHSRSRRELGVPQPKRVPIGSGERQRSTQLLITQSRPSRPARGQTTKVDEGVSGGTGVGCGVGDVVFPEQARAMLRPTMASARRGARDDGLVRTAGSLLPLRQGTLCGFANQDPSMDAGSDVEALYAQTSRSRILSQQRRSEQRIDLAANSSDTARTHSSAAGKGNRFPAPP
jgi:hypothetical protein